MTTYLAALAAKKIIDLVSLRPRMRVIWTGRCQNRKHVIDLLGQRQSYSLWCAYLQLPVLSLTEYCSPVPKSWMML